MATLKDVARLAEVSPSTVSRIINGKGDKCASPQVHKRVWEAVRTTGYVPNLEAKRLKEGAAGVREPVTISCLFARADDYKADSFFNALGACVEEEALRQGCVLGPRYSHRDALRLARDEGFSTDRTQGLVVLGKSGADCEGLIGRFKKRVVHITLNQMRPGGTTSSATAGTPPSWPCNTSTTPATGVSAMWGRPRRRSATGATGPSCWTWAFPPGPSSPPP